MSNLEKDIEFDIKYSIIEAIDKMGWIAEYQLDSHAEWFTAQERKELNVINKIAEDIKKRLRGGK